MGLPVPTHPCIKKVPWDFPGGPVVKNPLSNAGDAGSIPGWGTKIPHAMGQLSPRTTTRESKTRTPQQRYHLDEETAVVAGER